MRSELDYSKAVYETLLRVAKTLDRLAGQEPVKAREFMESLSNDDKEKFVDAVLSQHDLGEIVEYDEQNLEPLRREQKIKKEFERYSS